MLGTAAYLSPEQAAGEEVSAATDIYSLGAVVYELLTARPPYEFESLAELGAQQRGGVITPLRDVEPSVPEPVEAAVMHALARDPRFRPASASDFAHELASASELPTKPFVATAVSEPLHARTYRSLSGRRAWLSIAGATAVALVALILGLLSIAGGSSSSTKPQLLPIRSPARGATPAAQARNLSAWLRAHSK